MTTFTNVYHREPAVVTVAPGRVNLIGEHTDYNGGFVLPTVIPQTTQVALGPRSDSIVRVYSSSYDCGILSYFLEEERPGREWLDYVQGVTFVLRKMEHQLSGCDLTIDSTVPLGSGLSSSAALDVALLRAFRQAFNLKVDDKEIAILGQSSENQFVGAHVGIMDPLACSLGELHQALFLDALSLNYEKVPLPADADFVVINSGVSHQHSAGDYNTRRSECEEASKLLCVKLLRFVELDALPRINELPEPLNRRVRHVVTENARVVDAVAAIKEDDLERLGQLFYASHDSQRDDYGVSIPEIDLLVDLAHQDKEVYGARLTGGGFGGSIVLLAKAGVGQAAAERIAKRYQSKSGRKATVLATLTGAV
ncbi:MAG: galactokinase [Gemmataceae bacterium]